MDYSIFRENMRVLIDGRGITRKALAEELGFSPITISRYISGARSPETEHLVAIANYFRVTVDWLLGIGGERYETIPQNEKRLLDLYHVASSDDKGIIEAVLNKYLKYLEE